MNRPKTWRDTWPRFGRVLHHLWPAIRPQWKVILGSTAALLLGTVFGLLEPWPLKFLIDQVLTPALAGDVPAGDTANRYLAFAAISLVVINLLRAVLEYYRSVGFAIIGNRALTQVRQQLYRHLQTLPLAFHDKSRNGDLVVRVTGDINMLKDVASTALIPLVANVLLVVAMLGVMALMNWQLTLLAIACIPLFGLSTVRLSQQIRAAAGKQRRREGDLAATTAESMASIRLVRAMSLESVFERRFGSQTKKSLKEGVKTSRLTARLERSADVVTSIATALILWFGGQMVLSSALTLGELIVFITYLKRCFRPIRDFAKYAGRLAKATAAGERVIELLDTQSSVTEDTRAIPAPALTGNIEFQQVEYAYRGDHLVLKGIELAIPAGARMALLGESGAGKSTLLSLVLRLDDPRSGCVLIDGHDIRDLTVASLRSQIAVVLQDGTLFAGTIADNLLLGRPEASQEEMRQAARRANAAQFIEALPDGYDTIVGERGVMLSRGQRQRIAIARALVRDTPIVLLDEPLTGLDAENATEVAAALTELTKGRTTILVTHDPEHAAQSDVVYRLNDGRVEPMDRAVHRRVAGSPISLEVSRCRGERC
jgi:ATP-binding cassette, subfamily B, bacterial